MLKALVCIAVLAVCVFLALTVGDGDYRATFVGWAPLLACIMLLVLAYGYIAVAKRSLSFAESSFFAQCVRGEKAPFSLEFSNKGPLPLLNVVAEVFVADLNGEDAQVKTVSLTLAPRRTCTIPLAVPFDHVGCFTAGLKKVTISDFLGLFVKTIENHQRASIVVLPRVPRLGSMALSEDADKENFKAFKTTLADSLDYAYVRDYEWGDPLKTIHWKLSARADKYLTRLFEKSVSPGVTVVIDFSAPSVDTEEASQLRDAVVESALAMANYARNLGLDAEVRYLSRGGDKKCLSAWDGDALYGLVGDMPQAVGEEGLEARVRDYILETAASSQCQNNLVICSAQMTSAMVGTICATRRMRREPFFLAAVPRRLVDRDLERYLEPLAAIEGAGMGYKVVSLSDELEGGDIA